jgi:hypothetical protein
MQVPESWRSKLGTSDAPFLPLVDGGDDARLIPGWVTYEATLRDSPEAEVICGGLNSKTPEGAAVWRLGNLMHFGFEQSPDQLNQAGRDLLVNAIAYIARFTEDRPILKTPSPFTGRSVRARDALRRWLDDEEYPVEMFEGSLAPRTLETIKDRTRAGYVAWFEQTRAYLRPDDEGRLEVDQDAAALRLMVDSAGFFDDAIALLEGEPGRAARTRAVLGRVRPPEAPRQEATAAEWRRWFEASRPYLFFSEWGGYRWYVDPLARARQVPTSELRGGARADRPAADATATSRR